MAHSNVQKSTDQQVSPAPQSSWLLFVLIGLLAGLLVVYVTLSLGPDASTRHPWVGHPMPMFQLDSLLNADAPLSDQDLAGKVTLVNFWGPWCPPCLMEFPHLLQLQATLAAEDDFQLLSIANGVDWSPGLGPSFRESLDSLSYDAEAVLDRYQSDLPVYADTEARLREDLSLISPWSGYPTTLLVGRDGKIRDVWLGFQPDHAKVNKRIRQVLQESS